MQLKIYSEVKKLHYLDYKGLQAHLLRSDVGPVCKHF
jgi:hypothetical protein